jgi:hypothetical protein
MARVLLSIRAARVTVRNNAFEPHDFKASAETLKNMQVGDRIKAKRRPEKQ